MRWCLAAILLALHAPALAALSVMDDLGRPVVLAQPARRIVALTPHLTEDLFAIGAGGAVVGVSQSSDYPPLARRIARIGGYDGFDLERIRALHPDLVLAWPSGNPRLQLQQIAALGIPVYEDNATTLAQIPTELERLGVLTGHGAQAQAVAAQWRTRLARLQQRFAHKAPVRTFIEVWNHPLMTINDKQIISDSLRLCGAHNVFGDLSALVPTVDMEAVLAVNPQLIIGSADPERQAEWLARWQRWPQLAAVAQRHLVLLPPDLLSRLGPRMLDGTERLCLAVDSAR